MPNKVINNKDHRKDGNLRVLNGIIGDHITVQIARADIQKKQLDLALVDEKNPPRSISDLKKQKAPKPTYEKVGNRKKKRSSRRR